MTYREVRRSWFASRPFPVLRPRTRENRTAKSYFLFWHSTRLIPDPINTLSGALERSSTNQQSQLPASVFFSPTTNFFLFQSFVSTRIIIINIRHSIRPFRLYARFRLSSPAHRPGGPLCVHTKTLPSLYFDQIWQWDLINHWECDNDGNSIFKQTKIFSCDMTPRWFSPVSPPSKVLTQSI